MTLLNNLPRKLIFAIVIWLIGAVFFVGLTLNISWRLEDRGVAINTAGSLRKQPIISCCSYKPIKLKN